MSSARRRSYQSSIGLFPLASIHSGCWARKSWCNCSCNSAYERICSGHVVVGCESSACMRNFRLPPSSLLRHIWQISRCDLRVGLHSLFRDIVDKRTQRVSLGAAYQNPYKKDANATDNDLKRRAEERRIHVMIANPANHQEFDRHDKYGESCGRPEVLNQVRK
jgi:hypothetical protein